MSRTAYPADLTDARWQLIRPYVPGPKPGGRPAKYSRRELVNAILYQARNGCVWRAPGAMLWRPGIPRGIWQTFRAAKACRPAATPYHTMTQPGRESMAPEAAAGGVGGCQARTPRMTEPATLVRRRWMPL